MVDRAKIRAELNRVLQSIPDRLYGPDPERWGVTPDAQAGLAAAESMVAGQIQVP